MHPEKFGKAFGGVFRRKFCQNPGRGFGSVFIHSNKIKPELIKTGIIMPRNISLLICYFTDTQTLAVR